MTGGIASKMNNHCQPCKPSMPSRSSSWLETIEPKIIEIGIAVMKMPMIRDR